MKAVMYGGGNIGRGFIGMLFSQSGYEVTFIDVSDIVVTTLNRDHQYPVRIVSSESYEDVVVTNVSAVNGNDMNAVVAAIAEADIMATAVGVNVLKFIVPNIAAGLRKRFAETDCSLNIIICENLMDVNKVMEGMLKKELNEEEIKFFDEQVGLVEASVGRMVPVQTPDMQDGNPLRVCVERYGYFPVDKAAFRGRIPEIENMVPFEPFDFYIKRKLYIHNMGHATCAYLGMYTGVDYIYQSINDADAYIIIENAMLESALALSKKYLINIEDIMRHIQDLLERFKNAALKDTCNRVGGDPKRKLSPIDRLIGSAALCIEQNITPVFISIGVAGAVYAYLKECQMLQTEKNAIQILIEVSRLQDNSQLLSDIIKFYMLYANGTTIKKLRVVAEELRSKKLGMIV